MSPEKITGARQKGAFVRGMKDAHLGANVGDCPFKGAMMFKYWRMGYGFSERNPWVDCRKGFKEMLASYQKRRQL